MQNLIFFIFIFFANHSAFGKNVETCADKITKRYPISIGHERAVHLCGEYSIATLECGNFIAFHYPLSVGFEKAVTLCLQNSEATLACAFEIAQEYPRSVGIEKAIQLAKNKLTNENCL